MCLFKNLAFELSNFKIWKNKRKNWNKSFKYISIKFQILKCKPWVYQSKTCGFAAWCRVVGILSYRWKSTLNYAPISKFHSLRFLFSSSSIHIQKCYHILFYHPKKLLHQLYHIILQYTQHLNFYFPIQLIKIIYTT